MGKRQKMTENVHSESNYLLLAIEISTVDIEFTLPSIYLIACVTHISTLNIQKLWINDLFSILKKSNFKGILRPIFYIDINTDIDRK